MPEGAAQNCWGTFRGCNVARECRAALLWNDIGLKRLPRVLKVCLRAYSRRDQCGLSSDEKGAKRCPRVPRRTVGERFGGCNVAQVCRAELLGNV